MEDARISFMHILNAIKAKEEAKGKAAEAKLELKQASKVLLIAVLISAWFQRNR